MSTGIPVTVCVEACLEQQIQEITYDGQEILQPPLSMSENLTRLAQKIDFNELDEDDTKENECIDSKAIVCDSQSNWKWNSIRNKLRNALTEINVLIDVLQICKQSHYMVLDSVAQQCVQENRPLSLQLFAKKKALASAATILASGADQLKSSQIEIMKSKSSHEFHFELWLLRQTWRLKKVGNTILGDLSYHSAGSRFYQSGVFEVTKVEEPIHNQELSPASTLSTKLSSSLKVTIPSELEGISYIQVTIQKNQETLCNAELSVPNPNLGIGEQASNWKDKLEAAQNVLFCKELFLQLARDAMQVQAPIPHLIVGNQITASLFPEIQLIIGLCHSVATERRLPSPPAKLDHNHVLEHSLHQLLRKMQFDNINHPIPTPSVATLGVSRKRHLAGPETYTQSSILSSIKTETILEQIIKQAQHVVLRLRTMYVIDTLAKEIKDPLLVSHWNTLNSPVQSCVKINIISQGYETLNRTSLVVHVGERSLQTICRDGHVINMSYEPQELRDLILCQISHHQISAVQSLAKCMGWPVLSSNFNLGIGPVEPLGNASSCILKSPSGNKVIGIRCWPQTTQTGVQVMFSFAPKFNFLQTSLVKDKKWSNLEGELIELNWAKMDGKSFLNKMELLMACLSSR